MCGIFGLIIEKDAGFESALIKKALTTLAALSESRGKDSSGLVFRDESERELQVFKGAICLKDLLKRKEIEHQINKMLSYHNHTSDQKSTFAVMGHSRLVTNGSHLNGVNNQPVVKDGVIGIHNGIIVNEKDLWLRYPDILRSYEIDTEVMLALIRKYIRDGWDISNAVSKTIREILISLGLIIILRQIRASK